MGKGKYTLRSIIVRCVVIMVGVFITAYGAEAFVLANLGSDPVTAFVQGLSKVLPFVHGDFGMAMNVFNVLCFVVILIVYRKGIGVATVLYTFTLGTFCSMMEPWIIALIGPTPSMVTRVILVITGTLALGVGLGSYQAAGYGAGPSDGFNQFMAKTQKPKLVVLDMFCPSRFYDDFQPGWADENLDGMRISLNKLEAVYTSVQEEQSHFFLGFTEYHSRYDQLTTEDFQNFVWNRKTQERWKGYTPLNRHAELTEPDMSHVTTSQEMTEKSKEYFEKIVELTKKEGIALALISGPYLLEERDQEVYNSIGQLAEKDGLLFWNTNTPAHYREMGLDFSTDYADHAHLNEAGGAKYTAYLGKWLSQNYSFPDRRGQKGYESWENQLMKSGE